MHRSPPEIIRGLRDDLTYTFFTFDDAVAVNPKESSDAIVAESHMGPLSRHPHTVDLKADGRPARRGYIHQKSGGIVKVQRQPQSEFPGFRLPCEKDRLWIRLIAADPKLNREARAGRSDVQIRCRQNARDVVDPIEAEGLAHFAGLEVRPQEERRVMLPNEVLRAAITRPPRYQARLTRE